MDLPLKHGDQLPSCSPSFSGSSPSRAVFLLLCCRNHLPLQHPQRSLTPRLILRVPFTTHQKESLFEPFLSLWYYLLIYQNYLKNSLIKCRSVSSIKQLISTRLQKVQENRICPLIVLQCHTTFTNLLKQIKFLLLIYLLTYLKMFHLFLRAKNMKKQTDSREIKKK